MPVGAGIPRPSHPLERRFFTLGADVFRIRASAGSSRRPSQRVGVNHGKFGRRHLKDVAVVMELHEFAPVGRRFHGQAALGVSAAAVTPEAVITGRADAAAFAGKGHDKIPRCSRCIAHGRIRSRAARTRDSRGAPPRHSPARPAQRLPTRRASSRLQNLVPARQLTARTVALVSVAPLPGTAFDANDRKLAFLRLTADTTQWAFPTCPLWA